MTSWGRHSLRGGATNSRVGGLRVATWGGGDRLGLREESEGVALTRALPARCRVFYKVKSRSAHMKSHAEQEKKAAALRLKEKEAAAAAAHQQALKEESGEGEKG